MDYRQRCYSDYHLLWKQTHTLAKGEFELYSKVAKKKFLPFLPEKKSAKILDVACGSGHFLYFLKKEDYQNIKGIDISKAQLEAAKKMGVSDVELADLFAYLPKHVGAYEMVIANDIIEHLTKDEVFNFLDAIYAALMPGGRVLISAPNASALFGSSAVYIDFTHELGFTPTSLTHVLGLCGFKDIEIHGDGAIAHDLRSLLRAFLWKGIKSILRAYLIVENGTGRGLWKHKTLLEPRMFAIGWKPHG